MSLLWTDYLTGLKDGPKAVSMVEAEAPYEVTAPRVEGVMRARKPLFFKEKRLVIVGLMTFRILPSMIASITYYVSGSFTS